MEEYIANGAELGWLIDPRNGPCGFTGWPRPGVHRKPRAHPRRGARRGFVLELGRHLV